MISEKLRVIAISGSLREGSYTRMALKIALQGARELGAETEILNLLDYQLPFSDGNKDSDHPGVLRLRNDIRSAQGILLGSPEYHSGLSGVLRLPAHRSKNSGLLTNVGAGAC